MGRSLTPWTYRRRCDTGGGPNSTDQGAPSPTDQGVPAPQTSLDEIWELPSPRSDRPRPPPHRPHQGGPSPTTGTLWGSRGVSPCPPHRHDAFGAAPDALGDLGQGGQQAEDVVIVIAAVTQQQLVVLVTPRADPADVGIHLRAGIVFRVDLGVDFGWGVQPQAPKRPPTHELAVAVAAAQPHGHLGAGLGAVAQLLAPVPRPRRHRGPPRLPRRLLLHHHRGGTLGALLVCGEGESGGC